MSDPDVPSVLDVLRLENWINMSMNSLAIYEYITTFDQEVLSVWKRRPSGASMLLFATRHTMLLIAILNIIVVNLAASKECPGAITTLEILLLLSSIQTAAFSALRVYALCNGNIPLSALILLLQLFPFGVNAYAYTNSVIAFDSMFGCGLDPKYGVKTSNMLVYISRAPITLGDALVVIITWMKSFQPLRIQRNMGVQFSLTTLLFRDGTAYFLLLLTLNVLEMSPLTAASGGFVIGELSGTLPLILVNRFMLNLRQLSDSAARSAGHLRTISTPMFHISVDIAGNMGESLEHGWGARDDEGIRQHDQESNYEDGLALEEVSHNNC